MATREFDLVVLGGGSAGYAAALRAAELGDSVAVVERDAVGGTCLHRGCVPTKALLHTAEVADAVRHAAAVGVHATLDGVDPASALAWRRKLVEGKHRGLRSLLSARGVEVVSGEGRLLTGDGSPAIAVGDDLLVGRDVVLATGAASRALPGVAFGPRVMDSEGALALEHVPDRAVVIGGGVIGVEFASAWRSLGAEVVIVEAAETLVPNEDPAVRDALLKALRRRGIRVELSAPVSGVSETADGASVTIGRDDASEVLDADTVLVAIGRVPATAGIGLDEAGIALEGPFVSVDAELRTPAAHVWAAGDLVSGPQLAHRGFRHGLFIAERIHDLPVSPLDDALVPRVTYATPEIASVGLTEPQAAERFGADAVRTVEVPLASNAKSEIVSAGSDVRGGFAKVVRRVDGPVLGVHLVGPRVGELVTEGQLAVAWEATPDDLTPLVHAHPSQSEVLGEAFLALAGSPLHTL